MRSIKTLGLALALAVVAVSTPAEAKSKEVSGIDLQPAEPNRIGTSTGGRYASVLNSSGHRIVKDLMCSNLGARFVFDTGAGDHRACPGSSGVAPR